MKKARLHADICLRSIKLVQGGTKYLYSKSDIKNINTSQHNLNSATNYSILSIVWSALNLSKQEKQQIVSILRHYSGKNGKNKYSNMQATQKYLQRFKYKYNKQHIGTFQLTNNDKKKNFKQNSLTILYIVYRALQISSKFSAYRKFKKQNIP